MFKFLLILFIYGSWFEEVFPYITYLDELIAIIFIFPMLMKLIFNYSNEKSEYTKVEIAIFALPILLIIIGFLSTYYSNTNNTFYMELYTLLAAFKFIAIYISMRIIISDISKKKLIALSKFALKQTYVFTAIFIFLFLINSFFGFFEVFSYRFGINSISYGFNHPAVFSSIVIIQSIINLYFNMKFFKKINLVYISLNLILLLSAGRFTAIGFFIMTIVLLYTYRYFRKYVAAGIIISFLLMILVGFNRIIETFLSSTGARGILMNTAFKLAQDFFPFGSGLGTFGSHASRVNYSEIYHMYGLSKYYGLSPTSNFYITDSYWAMIIGEYGFIGALIWALLFILLFLNSYLVGKGILGYLLSLPILYLLLSSPIDTIIVSNSILPFIFVTIIILTFEKNFLGDCIINKKII